jgi:hypothetical protein
LIHTVDHHHQTISAAKRVTRTVNDKYPTLALAVAMPALGAVGVLDVLELVVVDTGVETGVEVVGVTELTPDTEVVTITLEPELEAPELEEVEVTESVEFPLVEVPLAEPEETVMDDTPEPAHVSS